MLILCESASKVENVGGFWDFGNETVYETKKLKGKMIGKAFRIKRDDLDEYIKKL